MKVAELMTLLADLPEDAEVLVWDGYNAAVYTSAFEVNYDWARRVVTLE